MKHACYLQMPAPILGTSGHWLGCWKNETVSHELPPNILTNQANWNSQLQMSLLKLKISSFELGDVIWFLAILLMPFVFYSQDFQLFVFQIFRLRVYMMKVIPEMQRVHYIWYLRFTTSPYECCVVGKYANHNLYCRFSMSYAIALDWG